MEESKVSYTVVGILAIVISVFALAASFIPLWGARVLYVAPFILIIALVLVVVGIRQKAKVGLLTGAVVLSLIASVVSYGQYRAVRRIEGWGRRTAEKAVKRRVPRVIPDSPKEAENKTEREALLKIKRNAKPCSYMGFVAMDSVVWHSSDEVWERLYLFAPARLLFGEDLSRDNVRNVISTYRRCRRFPADHSSRDAKAIAKLIGLTSSEHVQYVCEKQFVRRARKAMDSGFYSKRWWHYGLPLTAQQRQYLKHRDRLEKMINKMNEFQKRENSAVVDSLQLMNRLLEASIASTRDRAVSAARENYYRATAKSTVKDADYDFQKKTLRVGFPKILPLHQSNTGIVRYPDVGSWGYEVSHKVRLHDVYPDKYDMPRSDFFSEERGSHLRVPMTSEAANGLFSGRKTAEVTVNVHYSVASWKQVSTPTHTTGRGIVQNLRAYRPTIEVHSAEISHNGRVLLDYPSILYQGP